MTTQFINHGDKLEIKVQMDIAGEVYGLSHEVLERHIREAMIDELAKSPEFQEALRKIALERLMQILDVKTTR